jgi:hypothetical protein
MTNVHWLLLLYALPTRENSERVNVWRKLRKFGGLQLKSSGNVLPDTPVHFERLQWLCRQIQDANGEATLIRVAEIDGLTNDDVIGMFNDARAEEYKELVAACREALSRHKKGKDSELAGELQKCERRFREIREIDFFNSPAVHDAQMLLDRIAKTLAPQKGAYTGRKLDPEQFLGKTWLTRPRPGIDRAGSAWLIRKFIDPEAKFIFDMDPEKHPNAIPFDMANVEFSHHGDQCTFETFVLRFGITDKAVIRIAEMVHDADLEDEKFHRCECVGINCVLTGWAKTSLTDTELLAKGIDCFEGLYRQVRK